MANMNINERTQYERADLSVPSTGIRLRSTRAPTVYTVLAIPLLGVLAWAVVAGIDSWWQGLVLGVIVLTTVGLMIAVSPARRA